MNRQRTNSIVSHTTDSLGSNVCLVGECEKCLEAKERDDLQYLSENPVDSLFGVFALSQRRVDEIMSGCTVQMKSSLRGIQNEITLAVGTNSSHIVELVDVAVGMVLSFSPQIRNDFVGKRLISNLSMLELRMKLLSEKEMSYIGTMVERAKGSEVHDILSTITSDVLLRTSYRGLSTIVRENG